MHWIDYCIVAIPFLFLISVAVYSSKYARSAVDFLAAGRVAGRYVISVGDLTASLSVIVIVAGSEQSYQSGFALAFWNTISGPVGIFIALTGYCVYRWRETRCLSIGQFLEMRYGSKFFRIFCASLRTLAEMITNSLGPAIATNFFIYYLGLPHKIMIAGINLPTYIIIVILCLSLAILFIWPSGRISLLITDSFQGILSYPIFVIIVGYIILHFSWDNEVVPVMWNRVEGQSFINPYDISQLRNFNIFTLVVTLLTSVLNRASWIGNDTSGAAKTPHEQKMAGILGAWRNGFSTVMNLLLGVIVIVFMTSPNFTSKDNNFKISSKEIRQSLTQRTLTEAVGDDAKVASIMKEVNKISETGNRKVIHDGDANIWEEKLSQDNNLDTPYFNVVRKELGDTSEGRSQYQKYVALYRQMMMPSVLSKIFPVGILGLFCLLMIMLLISTDDSRIFNASSTLMQDIVLPLFKGHLDSKKHIFLLRMMTLVVALFFFIMAVFFSQLDFINMFTTIMTALWIGGAGPIMIFGLYSRFGNLAGAWCAIIFGSGTSLIGLILQRTWARWTYPFLERLEWVEGIDKFLINISSPFNPWISWEINPINFPINSFEILFISIILSVSTYVLGSYLTYKPFNLDKLLHRNEYADEHSMPIVKTPWNIKTFFNKIIGINSEYTKGDKVIAYMVFGYSFGYSFCLAFLGVVIYNFISPWPKEWWTINFFITMLVVPSIIGIISTVWLFWGSIRDSIRLFRDLENRVEDQDDNGQISG